jgi:Zn-dependent protease
VAIVALLVHTHHITEFTVIEFAVLIASIILHEVSHGVVALWFGDDTAKRAHRLTLNPIPHIDPLGTIILPVLLTLSGGAAFGWAKPVPVNLSRLRHPRNESVLVGLAGPAVNIILAVIAGAALGALLTPVDKDLLVNGYLPNAFWIQVLFSLGTVNVVLAVFNLIPIPPLDGASVIERFIPTAWLGGYLRIRPYTLFLPLIVVVLFPQALNALFDPAIRLWSHLLGLPTTVT